MSIHGKALIVKIPRFLFEPFPVDIFYLLGYIEEMNALADLRRISGDANSIVDKIKNLEWENNKQNKEITREQILFISGEIVHHSQQIQEALTRIANDLSA